MTTMEQTVVLCFVLLLAKRVAEVDSSAEVMKQMSGGFAQAADECKTEV